MIILDKIKMPEGFKAAGIHAGIKKIKKDMALIYSEKECSAAGTFTTNRVKAAPVKYDISILGGSKHGVVVNSGNANACTAERGDEDAKRMAALASSFLSGKAEDYFVCSTGVIGVPMDMDKIKAGVSALYPLLSAEGGEDAAAAMAQASTHISEWDEALIRQLVDTVKVNSAEKITVFLRGGVQVEQDMI